jgi:hypothetical protein
LLKIETASPRSRRTSLLLVGEFAEHGTELRALNDRGGGSPEGELTTSILDQIARYEAISR